MNKIDLTGQRYGKLIALSEAGRTKNRSCIWLCRCDCGNQAYVSAQSLRDGSTRSCGCLSKVANSLSHTRIYHIWQHMLQRCRNSKSDGYKYYGARKINVCDEWQNSFLEFYNWSIANGYTDTLSIDRIDVNGDYCPDNCRWTNMKTQQRNKRNNKYYEYNGMSLTIAEWAQIYGINYHTFVNRLHRGWDIQKAIVTPVKKRS